MIVTGMSLLVYPELLASVSAMVSREMVTTLVRSLGVPEGIVLFGVALLFFGPRSPRELANSLARSMQELQPMNAHRPVPRRSGVEDLLLLAIVVVACLLFFWIALG